MSRCSVTLYCDATQLFILEIFKKLPVMKVRILSIDGGGIRGIIPAVILDYIEKGLQRQAGNDPNVTLADYFDFVAGTSTGGILACYCLMPPEAGQKLHSRHTAEEAVRMYEKHGAAIFDSKVMRKGITKPKYKADGLEKVLKECLGDVTLAQSRKNCLVTAYDITARKAVLFTSPEAREHRQRDYFLRDVARATSAAPTYFEPAKATSMANAASYLIDGAMYAGNPAMCAVVEAYKTKFDRCPNPKINDLYIVSVGTGNEHEKVNHNRAKDWGAIGWIRPLIDVLLSASSEVVDYQLRQMFDIAGCSDCYVRLEPALKLAKPEMDDASKENIGHLKNDGERFVRNNVEVLDKIVKQLRIEN